MKRRQWMTITAWLLLSRATIALAVDGSPVAPAKPDSRFVSQASNGKLVYATDEYGNRVPDFSHCGYMGGGVAIPDAPVRVLVRPAQGDNGPTIQAAIDYVSSLPADPHGLRGAVLLLAGRHQVAGTLHIHTGGVMLRGQGAAAGGTVLAATGTERRSLIRVTGQTNRAILSKTPYRVSDQYVPVGSCQLRLDSAEGLQAGDTILVERPSTAAWIAALGMDRFPGKDGPTWLSWQPGKMDLRWDRVITEIDGSQITLDAPLTTALDAALGGGQIHAYRWPGRIAHIGVENLRCESDYATGNPHDEEHAWAAISMDAAHNAWVRQVTTAHFAGSAVSLLEGCRHITVEDCQALKPISEIGGYRRHTFYTSGQQTLFQRCFSEHGIHDFAVGYLAAGPNVFLECEAVQARGFSGPIESWASGVLYDNVAVDGGGLALTNREIDAHGVGWAAANCVLWQCTAPLITCRRPPTARNWAIGCWGQFLGDGNWQATSQLVRPASLYRAQLVERLGTGAATVLERRAIPISPGDAKSIDDVIPVSSHEASDKQRQAAKPIAVQNGWLVCAGKLLTGSRTGTIWWKGDILPSRAAEFGIGVTRFVPGRVGPGFTDDLDQLTDTMRSNGQVLLEHHWGLWYDRRRDDHQMVRRLDGDVWPPFYEQPWARSGQGVAWDGLSRYDLTRFNPWYFGRLHDLANLCDRKGLVLLHQMYFQHNLLEAGAHWADFPWRPANCLQDTGFPEPPPYQNKKRIFMAEAFYDVAHPLRRSLHRAYIRKCLDNFADNTNVIHLIGAEYTGPLAFVRFWLDVVAEWEADTGKKALIGLSCTRDVQDAILADPARAPKVALIDLRYWWYAADGSLYAPGGGQSLAPRQHYRQWPDNKRQSPAQTARQIRDYRRRFPDKAILCSLDKIDAWLALAAGASIPNIAHGVDDRLLVALPRLKPFEPHTPLAEGQWAVAEPGRHYLIYPGAAGKIRLDLSDAPGTYSARWLDPRTGAPVQPADTIAGGRTVELATVAPSPRLLWLTRN
jgi:hypothetical protein